MPAAARAILLDIRFTLLGDCGTANIRSARGTARSRSADLGRKLDRLDHHLAQHPLDARRDRPPRR